MATLLLLEIILVQASMAAMAKPCPGPMLSDLTLSMAAVESTKTVYRWPLSCLWLMMLRAWKMAYTSASKTSQDWVCVFVVFYFVSRCCLSNGGGLLHICIYMYPSPVPDASPVLVSRAPRSPSAGLGLHRWYALVGDALKGSFAEAGCRECDRDYSRFLKSFKLLTTGFFFKMERVKLFAMQLNLILLNQN